MIPINIYMLTRVCNHNMLQKMERQMSKREQFLNIKDWEIDGIRNLSEHLHEKMKESVEMCFYYSFQIPKLGKEFDLLRISDDLVINIELKSGNVSDEFIKKQLLQNRYYLASLGKTVRSYTYISEEDRLLRLTNSEKLMESDWESLCKDLQKQGPCYMGDAKELFKEEQYLISPLTDPDKFLNREYFLTFQQKDIRNHILHKIEETKWALQGFTGLPGTGKTLLLYDIAMQLSLKQKVCVLHFGHYPDELMQLNMRLKRIDFYNCQKEALPDLSEYAVIFVDEGHQITKAVFDRLIDYARQHEKPLILSYDQEEAISVLEKQESIRDFVKQVPDFVEYRLTNRIRMNIELSNFIHCMLHPSRYHKRQSYPSVSVSYAKEQEELENLLHYYQNNEYVYLDETPTCREFNKVVMVVSPDFYYDEEGYLRTTNTLKSDVRNLFYGLNRAKKEIALVVYNNTEVLEVLLSILQRGNENA